jgi:hypothetical protein
MAWHDRRETFGIEAGHQGRHGIARPTTRRPGRIGIAAAVRHHQHRFGACHWAGGKGLASTQAYQLLTLLLRERAKWVLWAARHGDLLFYP